MSFADLVSRFAIAAASGNSDALADLFTDDGTYDDYFFGPYTGRAAIKAMLVHFAEGGSDFHWTFHDPVAVGDMGYASYRFSYRSKAPEAAGARVTFDGMAKFALRGGKIAHYSEVFDRGMALAQQNYAPERLAKIGEKYATKLQQRPDWAEHL